jgi:hypothetical protein
MLTGFGPGEESGDECSEFLDLTVAKPVNGARLRQAIQRAFA